MKKGFHFHDYDLSIWPLHIPATRSEVVRFEVMWAYIEPQPGVYDQGTLAFYDSMMQACYDRNITPIVLFGYIVPEWVRAWPSQNAPPSDLAKWGEFARFIAKRWPKLRGLEVWNEPNLPTFWGDRPPDPVCSASPTTR
jgi:beta-glucosidase/6-phospho-beta-glucosidase/beta-galactosidase